MYRDELSRTDTRHYLVAEDGEGASSATPA